MKSISPIIATILIVVMTVAIAGLFYAFTSGLFGSLTQSSSQQIQQQSQVTSFEINNVYCSNNILYFNIYNNGNIPIDINNSQIIFTDNNGNIISINGSNIICNNGNIIPSGSNSLCYIINNYFCYYSYTNYIKSTNFVYNGISYSYNILSNKFMIHTLFFSITIYNTQNSPTPQPFQQDIAICNGNINIGNNFAYVNNMLFNGIDSNGQNVYFTTTYNSTPNIYSWYEGQEDLNGVTCDVWWINLPNGIPANSSITIYMYVGNSSANYYSQYYPYVGEAPQLSPTYGEYDNGNYIFLFYDNFAGTSLNTSKWTSLASVYTINNGLQINATPSTTDNNFLESKSTYSVPLIIEIYRYTTVSNWFGFSFPNTYSSGGVLFYDQNEFYGPNGWSIYNGYQKISGGSESLNTWYIQTGILALNGQALEYINYINVISSPNGYYAGTSGNIYVGDNGGRGIIQWLRIRAYPPNDVMPSIYIG